MLVSIVILCTSDKINLFYERLCHILRRVDFSYELIFVYQQNEVYLETRPSTIAKWICVPRFTRRKQTIFRILEECQGDFVVLLSPEMYESLFYMLDAITLLEDNQNLDMITAMEDAVFYSSFRRWRQMISTRYESLFYTFRKKQVKKAIEKKRNYIWKFPTQMGLSIYYLPYTHRFYDKHTSKKELSIDI